MSQIEWQIEAIKTKLRRLQKRGWFRHRHQFGVTSHRFALNPRIDEAELAAFERRYGIALPNDYRQFLLRVGNGGAGPYAGILPLAEWDMAINQCDTLREDFLALPSPLYSGFQREQDFNDEDDEHFYLPYRGSIAVAHQGCDLYSLLIVSGEHRGRVCYMNQDNIKAWFVRDATFLDWYERWLEESLAGQEIWWFGCD